MEDVFTTVHLFPVKPSAAQQRAEAAQQFIDVTARQAAYDRKVLYNQSNTRNQQLHQQRDFLLEGWKQRGILMERRKLVIERRHQKKLKTNLLKRKLIDRRNEQTASHSRWLQAERERTRREQNDLEDQRRRLGRAVQESNGHLRFKKTSPRASTMNCGVFYDKDQRRVLKAVLGINTYNVTNVHAFDVESDQESIPTEKERCSTSTAHYYVPQSKSFVPVPEPVVCRSSTLASTLVAANMQIHDIPSLSISIEMEAIPVRPQTTPMPPTITNNRMKSKISNATSNISNGTSNTDITPVAPVAPVTPAVPIMSTMTTSSTTSLTSPTSTYQPCVVPKLRIHGVAGGGFKGRRIYRKNSSQQASPRPQSGVHVVEGFQRKVLQHAQGYKRGKSAKRQSRPRRQDLGKTKKLEAKRPIVAPWRSRRREATQQRTLVLVGRSGDCRAGESVAETTRKNVAKFVPKRPPPEKRILPSKRIHGGNFQGGLLDGMDLNLATLIV